MAAAVVTAKVCVRRQQRPADRQTNGLAQANWRIAIPIATCTTREAISRRVPAFISGTRCKTQHSCSALAYGPLRLSVASVCGMWRTEIIRVRELSTVSSLVTFHLHFKCCSSASPSHDQSATCTSVFTTCSQRARGLARGGRTLNLVSEFQKPSLFYYSRLVDV
jgi:hypothetical protein